VTIRLPVADWPALDRALWEKGVKPKDLFESGGAGAKWSEDSRFKTARGYRHWLVWLTTLGLCDPNLGPADRVTPERVAAYVAELTPARAPYTVLCRVQELYDAMRVMSPEKDWDWLLELYRTLSARVRPVRDNFSRLKSIDELVALGERLVKKAEAVSGLSARRRAVLFRDGLMIALLAYRPVRQKNFASMRLGQHLTKVGDGWQIQFAATETKTHVPYEAIVPSALVSKLERYLDVHRPVLMHAKSTDDRADAPLVISGLDAVWVSEVKTQLEQHALACRIVKHTKAAFGRCVSPHRFRDCAATSIAVDNPKHIGDASLVLSHSGHRTTEKHYNRARSLEASRRHTATLERLRRSLMSQQKG
jgi:hypothetical protein